MVKTFIISAILGLFSVTAHAANMQQMEAACDAGVGIACGELAAKYYCAPWNEVDCVKGRALFEKSCNYDVANACGALADLYERAIREWDIDGFKQSYRKL